MTTPLSRRSFLRASASSLAGAGLGAAFAGTAGAQAAPALRVASGPVLLNYNESPHGPSPAAREAIVRLLPETGRYLFEMAFDLARVFAEKAGISPETVAVYAGSSEPLDRAALAFTSPSAGVVVANPTFDSLEVMAARHDAAVHAIPLREDGSHDVEAMVAADPQAGLIYICNPNNPTGTVTPRAGIEWVLAHKPASSIVLVDEAYIEYTDEPSCVDLAEAGHDLVVLRTFSKIYGMAGLRLGLAIARPDLLARLTGYGLTPVPSTAVVAGLASLRDPDLVPARKRQNAVARDDTIAWLRQRGHACTASQTNFFMFDLETDGNAFSRAMAENGVVIGRAWPLWPNRVRVSVGTEEDMAAFRETFARVVSTA